MNAGQLMKGQIKRDDKEHKKSLEKLIPIAEYVLKLMTEYKCPMGDITGTQPEEYKVIALKIQQKFLDENVKWVDRQFVFQLAQQTFDFVRDTTLNHLDKSFNFASNKLWGGKDMLDLTMKDIDDVLKRTNDIKLKG